MNKKIINLTPPLLEEENIDQKITCIRGHRERIFQIYSQEYQNKIIFHNYGHGGAGWTFLFGSVNKSIRQLEAHIKQHPSLKNKPIAIVGAGCYGLLTTLTLAHKGYNVRIIAKETENLTSHKAAGFFFPRWRKCSTPEEIEVFMSVGMESYATYKQISLGQHPFIQNGPKIMPCYFAPDIDPGFSGYIAQGLMDPPKNVTIDFGNGKTHDSVEYKTLFINPQTMMQELERNVRDLEIQVTNQEITNFEEVQESIIFNCSGIGSRELTTDKRIVPIQGHLITLKNQPNLDQLQYMVNAKVPMLTLKGYIKDELVYFAPKGSGILGITFIRGQDSPTANQHEFERLLERCQDYFGIKNL